MEKESKINLKNATVLSDIEMKQVIGGSSFSPCNSNYQCATDEYCVMSIMGSGICVGGDETPPKVKACEGKKLGDPCQVVLLGELRNGRCVAFVFGNLYCSDLEAFKPR